MQAYYLPGVSRLLLSSLKRQKDSTDEDLEVFENMWFGDPHAVRINGENYIGSGVASAFFAAHDPGLKPTWITEVFSQSSELSAALEEFLSAPAMPTSERDVFVPLKVVKFMFQALDRDGRVPPLAPYEAWVSELEFDLQALAAPETPETPQ